MNPLPRRILLTGGGTAGHVTPNLALLTHLRRRGYDVRYVGTARGIERSLITAEGVPYYPIPAGKLRRYADVRNVTDIARIAAGFLRSLAVVAGVRPAALFSKGGFVACPVVWASWLLRVPVIVHESDISPGLANRLSFPFAKKICFSFPETAPMLPPRKAVETGIPVRETLFGGDPARGRERCGFTDTKPVLLMIGGSQGSQAVNACLRQALGALLPRYNVCHLCGPGNRTPAQAGYAQFEYADRELPDLYACADAVVSRAGATVLFELLSLNKPALLIPLPLGASRGDQIHNARSFERRGWSMVLPQEEMTPAVLTERLHALFRDRELLASRMKGIRMTDAADKILDTIEQTMR